MTQASIQTDRFEAMIRKATLKGHGNPTKIMYFGDGKEPLAAGWLVTVVTIRPGNRELIDETGAHTAGWVGNATRFWGQAVQA